MKPAQIVVCLILSSVLSNSTLANENFSIKNLISMESGKITTITLDCVKENQGQDFTCEPIVYSFKNALNQDLEAHHSNWLKWAKNNKGDAERRIHDSVICDEIRKERRGVEKTIETTSTLTKKILILRAKQCENTTIERAIKIHELEKKRNYNTCQIRGPAILAKWSFTKSRENHWTSTYLSSCGYTYIYGLTKDSESNIWTLKKTIVGDRGVKESELCMVDKTEETFDQKEVFSWRDMPLHLKCEYLDFVNY